MLFVTAEPLMDKMGPLVMGVFLLGGLGLAALYARLHRRVHTHAPGSGPQPRSAAWASSEEIRSGHCPPDHGPGHDRDVEPVEYEDAPPPPPAEVPRDGRRRMPYELRDSYPGRPTS
ncbi:hypothetical protein [Streptantibioticus cattleyicolor]|uniref:Uncharacterized protein n=1 Tax=Streptantibioticus cattleyicolor (strain ATCC 35852 / DSM 46488 / JCM 4925 / NBRC 14057 / NRRL 8057) TaxID=1003195 RepID=F8JMB9_STREN|nr:hypothetical protein [Streptantibioticus cattleyicolor]AEW99254.1 hypothetical protein SCATT_p10610 [Streptantibioticus cattleyicolor NRRL 8057 = DSM 46488]CCB71703.1 protein of unknown function [Streptantibioticus cattleyicolor NRRL 8057 = DSM 46488]